MRAKVIGAALSGATNLALMAPIKSGFADAVETITYLERLKRLLDASHDSRRNTREAELDAPVFPDTIGRFGVIQQFRYAIWPPIKKDEADAAAIPRYLTLNVTFDGGWEPYMRVIYRDIGALLDALLCHCDGYPGSRNVDFDAYCRWVRDHELDAGLFYTDSPVTGADARYLAQMERIQRENSNPATAEETIARLALTPLKRQREEAFARVLADPERTLALPLRALKGLFRLAPLFGDGEAHDDVVLHNFARLVLREFVELAEAVTAKSPSPPYAALAPRLRPYLDAFADELSWLLHKVPPGNLAPVADETYDPQKLQNAILNRDDPVTHGCVVMLSVRDRVLAAALLKSRIPLCKSPTSRTSVRWQFAFTHAGLAALGVEANVMDVFPPEFAEGMEARCSILGDLRANHPNQWRRPLRYGAPANRGDRIDLSTTHVVVLLRLVDQTTDAADLHPAFVNLIKQLDDPVATGLSVLAVEPTRSRRDAKGQLQPEHFGFADGRSQPKPVKPTSGPKTTDEVNAGELLLGYRNDRGDDALPAHKRHALFPDGSFLVIRKLRQRVDRLDSRMEAAYATRPDKVALVAEARAKMMGRRQDGQPLLNPTETAPGNAFNFDQDAEGRFCPFQSHIRRANPRDGRNYMPRILRRGMSYGPSPAQAGPEADRGVMFMAYCGSIAEQFETIQGWIAGGNSSGLSSAQADPFLAVPRPGEQRSFRYFDQHGQLQRVTLGDQPLVELQWGLYLFVPSLNGLAVLADTATQPQPAPKNPGSRAPWVAAGDLESWREQLEVQDQSPAVWAQVRQQPGGRAAAHGYGTLVGDLAGVKQALQDSTGTHYSVKGYAQRMDATIGVNLLGLDPQDPLRAPQADPVNALVEQVSEAQAFAAAWPLVQGFIQASALLDQPPRLPPGDERIRRPVDLVSLGERVLAKLCTYWFGLPESPTTLKPGESPFMVVGGRNEGAQFGHGTPRCPGELLSSSRTIFAPHPNVDAAFHGIVEGPRVLDAVRQYLQSGRPRPALTVAIVDALTQSLSALPPAQVQNLIELNLAGMLLGFPPTVFGNFMQVTKTWIEQATLWSHQQAVAEAVDEALEKAREQAQGAGHPLPRELDVPQLFDCASAALRPRLMATMRRCPIPETLWRSPIDKGGYIDTEDEHRVVLGIRSALAGLADDRTTAKSTAAGDYDELMFGGSRNDKRGLRGLHACPGYHMGVGVLLALLAGLLLAGTLRPTGSPVLLMLTPKPPTP